MHTPISLDAHEIVKEGGAAIQPVGEVDTIGGLHRWGTTAEDSNKVILEGLNGFFSHVALVFLGGD